MWKKIINVSLLPPQNNNDNNKTMHVLSCMSFARVNSLAGKLLITGDLNVHFYRPLAPDYVIGRVFDL